jgi:uncharacterized protein YndB with AHSA1/START domain
MAMKKYKFTGEYEINASPKMLFPYLNTAAGLSQWFADNVNINEDKTYNFIWDGEDHKAKIASQRTNTYVKFEFLEDVASNGSPENGHDPSFIEFKIDTNELTQSVFLKITDYSDTADEEEMEEIWDNLVHSLKEIIGG